MFIMDLHLSFYVRNISSVKAALIDLKTAGFLVGLPQPQCANVLLGYVFLADQSTQMVARLCLR